TYCAPQARSIRCIENCTTGNSLTAIVSACMCGSCLYMHSGLVTYRQWASRPKAGAVRQRRWPYNLVAVVTASAIAVVWITDPKLAMGKGLCLLRQYPAGWRNETGNKQTDHGQ